MTALLRIIAFMLLAGLSLACRPPQGDMGEMGGSELKWGHLRFGEAAGTNWLGNIGPQDQIELCGDAPQKLELAIRKWGDAIGRGQYLKLVQCNQATAAKKIRVTLRLAFTEYPCTMNGVQGATTPNDGVVRICQRLAAPEAYVILHEIGHMWGMCDMYPGQTQTCDTANMTQIDNSAIMGNGSVKDNPDLSKDDKDGIIAMNARPEFATVKQAWDAYIATNPRPETGAGTPGPVTTAQNDIFLALDTPDVSGNSVVWLATNSTVNVAMVCQGDKTVCGPGKPGFALERATHSITTRSFFKSSSALPLGSYTGKLTLMGFDASSNMVVSNVVELRRKQ